MQNKPGQEVESTNLYLQAALKFLQAASIVENENNDTHRAGKTQSMVVYDDTAKLCKYCAGQYERSRDMAAAALAYTCAAVALGRRMLCKNATFARDCNELLAAAQPASGPHITSNGPLLPPPVSRSADKPGSSLAMMPGTGIGRSHPPRKISFFFLSLFISVMHLESTEVMTKYGACRRITIIVISFRC
jgi:hypothetical protein